MAEEGCRFGNNLFNVDSLVQGQRLPPFQPGTAVLSFIEGNREESTSGRLALGWPAMVEEYTRRKLTYEDDKMPALSGLANAVYSLTGGSYLAGLWKDHIIEDVHWRTYTRIENSVQVYGGFKHVYGAKICDVTIPIKYRAPSWSWASLCTRSSTT
ncbi:hypothetical protein K440DRAFT_631127 [Wilcoxina mikolae CBS 423.85]|nr:hypothetical protein K440DRAFT_631127 [Wilcoxina mikolae CBS 423.85]